ncbi:MAG TPA: hypothetical protein VGL28_08750 [Steroidobacteraceae bacterium]|jgi:hypothetical protein
MFGRFLELGIATPDIASSVLHYERLGFSQLITGDAFSHRYGVLSDGRVPLGLHQRDMPSPTLTFVLPQLWLAQQGLRERRFVPEMAQFGEDALHQLRLRDPGGHAITLLEARTYSPADRGVHAASLCGYFSHLSLPQPDFHSARDFWERAGFVALQQEAAPFAHLPLTSDHLDLAFHAPQIFDAPLLIFECADLTAVRSRLSALNVPMAVRLPRGMDPRAGVLLQAPEGTAALVLAATD